MDRRRLLMKQGRLPSAYQQVEWIASSGTQYIDTEYVLSDSNGFYLDANITFVDTSGVIGGSGSVQRGCSIFNWNGDNLMCYVYGNNTNLVPAWSSSFGLRHQYKGFRGKAYLDGDLVFTIQREPVSASITAYLFWGKNNAGTFANKAIMTLYECALYDNDENIAIDFIPCYRKSDNEIGMYDLVTGTFFTNAGSGTFTKGPDVN